MNALSSTQFRDIAREVVGDQQRVCAVQMKNIEDKLDGVISDVSDVKKDFGAVKADLGTVKTDIAVIKTRIAIGVAAIVGLPMLIDFIRGLLAAK